MRAAYAACLFTKQCTSRVFSKNGTSTTTTDMIKEIHPFLSIYFESKCCGLSLPAVIYLELSI